MMLSKAMTTPLPEAGDESDSAHVPLREVAKAPIGNDPEVGIIFREMRKATDLSLEELSEKLQTPTTTITALESGTTQALPDWMETSRIIIEYTGMLGLDSRPILRRLSTPFNENGEAKGEANDNVSPTPETAPTPSAAEIDTKETPEPAAAATAPAAPPAPPGAAAQQAKAEPQAPIQAPAKQVAEAETKDAEMAAYAATGAKPVSEAKQSHFSMSGLLSWMGAVFSWVLLFVFLAAMAVGVIYMVSNPNAVWSAVDKLPEPASRAVKSAWELVRPQEEVGNGKVIVDPSGHKADKLPLAPRQ